MRKILLPAIEVSGHAGEVLTNMGRFYRVAQHFLLRVIVEGALDTASDDGDVQREMAAAARFCREHDHVPDCWLDQEGERFEDGPDNSGSETYLGNEKTADRELRQSWANYGDAAAQWGERTDNDVYLQQRINADRHRKRPTGAASLKDAGETSLPARQPDEIALLAAAAPEPVKETLPAVDEHLPEEVHVDDLKTIRAMLVMLMADWRSKAREARTQAQDLQPFNASRRLHVQADLLEQCADTLAEAIAGANGKEGQ